VAELAMKTDDPRPLIRQMIAQAHQLAADPHVMVRVAGERIATILADLLYEIDPQQAEVFSLLPPQRRD
jgi:hypothetical protein